MQLAYSAAGPIPEGLGQSQVKVYIPYGGGDLNSKHTFPGDRKVD